MWGKQICKIRISLLKKPSLCRWDTLQIGWLWLKYVGILIMVRTKVCSYQEGWLYYLWRVVSALLLFQVIPASFLEALILDVSNLAFECHPKRGVKSVVSLALWCEVVVCLGYPLNNDLRVTFKDQQSLSRASLYRLCGVTISWDDIDRGVEEKGSFSSL